MARILAVDDERAILDALARVLGRDGHEVVKAADPTAVPGTDLSRFDLVLCDVMMPGLDGFELVRQIRPGFDGPIIFLTARVAEEDAVAGYGLGADDYVRKPFGAATLARSSAARSRPIYAVSAGRARTPSPSGRCGSTSGRAASPWAARPCRSRPPSTPSASTSPATPGRS